MIGKGQPILVIRRPRSDGEGWASAQSWLGGLPTLGQQEWPRDPANGLPLSHIARIDLSEVAQAGSPGLPESGVLSFFASTDMEDFSAVNCAVRFCDREDSPTDPPEDLPPLYGQDQSLDFFGAKKGEEHKVFPKWPAKFAGLTPMNPVNEPHMEASFLKPEIRERFGFAERLLTASRHLETFFRLSSRYSTDIVSVLLSTILRKSPKVFLGILNIAKKKLIA